MANPLYNIDMKRNAMTLRNQRGLMLGEILLIVLLVSILALIIVPRYAAVSKDAKYEADSTNITNINSLVQLFYIREGTWPAGDLTDIGTNINYFPAATLPTCPVTTAAKYILQSTTRTISGHSRNVPTHP